MGETGHKSVEMVLRYVRQANAFTDNSALANGFEIRNRRTIPEQSTGCDALLLPRLSAAPASDKVLALFGNLKADE